MNGEDKELVEEWFKIKNISRGTQKSYKLAMKHFIETTHKNPMELIQEAQKEELHTVPRQRNVNNYLYKFKNYLTDSNLSPSTQKLYFYAICSFYKAFDLNIANNVYKGNGDLRLKKNNERNITSEEICQLMNVSPARERAIICLTALSGVGQKEIRNLTIKQLLNCAGSAIGIDLDDIFDLFIYEEEISSEIMIVDVVRSKNNVRHHIMIPPEASKEIIAYLKERYYGENEKIRIKNNDDTLFVNAYGKKLSRDSVVTNLRYLGEKAGFKREKNVYSFWRFQSLRVYFVSSIISKTFNQITAYYLAGLRVSQEDREYFNKNPEVLIELYKEFLPFLSLKSV